jgi:hypothetical protein
LFEKLKSIVADSHDLIDAIKSRVIDLQGARKDERLSLPRDTQDNEP